MTTPILRRTLSAPLSQGRHSFTLPCKKLILEYSEEWGSNRGMKAFIASPEGKRGVIDLARRNPGVEVVVRRVQGKHPVLRGVYANGNSKVICVRSLPPPSIESKAQLLLDSSGAKIGTLKRPQVESSTESVRGVWSGFH
ncbi:hypothetical protein T439DRAFT_307657 [Meredithblackwellia eburnea MCA 4105]